MHGPCPAACNVQSETSKDDPVHSSHSHGHVDLLQQHTCCWYQWLYLTAMRAYDQSLASSTPFTCRMQNTGLG